MLIDQDIYIPIPIPNFAHRLQHSDWVESENFPPKLTFPKDDCCVQVATFGINYRGHPFMESLTENRALLYSLAGAGGFVVMLALGE